MRTLDLFSGIGGFSLGLERSGGFRTVAFCEIDPYCRAVLAKHWPGVPIYEDVRSLTAARLATNGIAIDAICGGFPCQDVSVAGKRAGIDAARSGLWREFARLIGEIRPRVAIVENVPGLLTDGLGRVLGDLAALGYDAEWHCIPASAVGAPHRRDRVWIVAHPHAAPVQRQARQRGESNGDHARTGTLADSDREGCENFQGIAAPAERHRIGTAIARRLASGKCGQWSVEPALGRVAHGVPHRVDRLRSLGNAVVPQIPEMIGRAIMESEMAA